LTVIADETILCSGVQAATRPRTGLSPPDRFDATTGSDANLLSPESADTGPKPKEARMSDRYLPVRPNLEQLKHQAKDLLRDIRRGDPSAIEEFNQHYPKPVPFGQVKLADAQLALARSYQAPSWRRLVQACKLIDAIWRDDI
jgi:hypothetical protein